MAGSDGRSGPTKKSSRRQLLAGIGTASAVALAGCSALTNQSFAASAVGVPADLQTELGLDETARESQVVTLNGPADSEVEITSEVAVYSRAQGLGGQ